MGSIVSVNFRGDELYGFENDDGTFVALKPMVEAMGLNWSGQEQRVKRDPILSEGICVMHTPFGRGGAQDCLCIKMELVNGWLFGIDSTRIKDEAVRDKVQLYQRECFRVLHDHFTGKAAKPRPQIEEEMQESETARIRMVTESRHTFGNQAAAQLWFKVGLPIVPAMMHDARQREMFDYGQIKPAPDVVPERQEEAA